MRQREVALRCRYHPAALVVARPLQARELVIGLVPVLVAWEVELTWEELNVVEMVFHPVAWACILLLMLAVVVLEHLVVPKCNLVKSKDSYN